jgi:hypothetical protein
MGRAGTRQRAGSRPGSGSRAILAALLLISALLLQAGCHGRPLLSQMAPGSDLRAGNVQTERSARRARATRAELDRYSRARDLFEGRAPLTPVENVLKPEHYRKLVEDQLRRDPRSSEARTQETLVREQVDELMASPAKPSFMAPEKGYLPGQVGLDPIAISWLIVNYMRTQQARR